MYRYRKYMTASTASKTLSYVMLASIAVASIYGLQQPAEATQIILISV